MYNTKCASCMKGAILIYGESIYRFQKAIEKDKEINYKNDEIGCRSKKYKHIEEKCLNNNFSEYEPSLYTFL